MSKIKSSSFRKIGVVENPYEGRVGLIYVRVSDKKQETQGHGRESQEVRCKEDLASINVPFEKTFHDTYTGGGDFMNRPAMRDMLAYIDARPHKKFLVDFDDLKRFARDTEFHLKLRAAFRARDVIVRCLNYNFDDSPEGLFVETVLAAGNELERKQNARQVVQKQRARLTLGYWPFVAKRGYKMVKNAIHSKLSVPDKKNAPLIAHALEGFSTCLFPRRVDACRYLIENGFWKGKYPEKYTDEFTAMLKDCFHMGDIEFPAWEVSRRKGKHKGVISSEVFERNQKRLENEITGKRIRIDLSKDFYLRGLTACSHCIGHITGAWTQGATKRHPYYFCQTRGCPFYRKSIKRKNMEKEFATIMRKQKAREETIKLAELMFERVWQDEVKAIKSNEMKSKHSKEILEEKINRLTDMVITAKSPALKKTYESQLEDASNEMERLNDNLTLNLDFGVPYRTALDKALGLLKSPYSVWTKLELPEQQKLFFFIFEEKLQYDRENGYRTDKILSYTRLFEEFATAKSDNVVFV